MPLTARQRAAVGDWFPAAEVVADLSWGQIDTTVLHVRTAAGDVIVKAGGPGNHHVTREIVAHRSVTAPWLAMGRIGRLLAADDSLNVLAVEFLPGHLIDATEAALDADVHRQAGHLLAALHAQASRLDDDYERRLDATALARLDAPHRIAADVEAEARSRIAAHEHPPAVLVPTHGDWQPRNWLLHEGQVFVIDLGRAEWRPALADLARLASQQWVGRPDLEAAFLDGYGADPREPAAWRRSQLREAIGTAVWAYQVGDESFEQQGHRMLAAALDG